MNLRRYNRILAQTSPSIIRSGSEDIRDKAWSCKAGFQRNLAMPNTSYIKIEDPRSQCKSSDHYKFVRSCSIQLFDIFNYKDTEQNCIISEYGSSKCMICEMIIIDTYFTSNLTKTNTRNYDDLTCKSTNVVYCLECNLCGLVYVGWNKMNLSTFISIK